MKNSIKFVVICLVLSSVLSKAEAQRSTPNGSQRSTPTRIPLNGQSTSTTTTRTTTTPTTTTTSTRTTTTTSPTTSTTTPTRRITPGNVNVDNLPPTPKPGNVGNLPLTPGNVDQLPTTPGNVDALPSTPGSLPSTPARSSTLQSLPSTPALSSQTNITLKTTPNPQVVNASLPPTTPSVITTAATTSTTTMLVPPTATSSLSFSPTQTIPIINGTAGPTPPGTDTMTSTSTTTTTSTTTFMPPSSSSTTTTLMPPSSSTTTMPFVPMTTSTSTTTIIPPNTSTMGPTPPMTSTTPSTTTSALLPTATPSLTPGPTVSQTLFVITTTGISTIVPPSEIVNSDSVNALLLLCNNYYSVSPPSNTDTYLYYIQQQLINQFGSNFDSTRIAQVTLSSNPDTGRLVLQFVVRPGQGIPNSEVLKIISQNNFRITDINGNVFDTSCGDYKFIPWNEYWQCPDQRCVNGGLCRVSTSGQYSCMCPNMFTGKYCNTNLWPLLTIPAILFLLGLLTLILCLWCCRKKRRLQTTAYISKTTEMTTTEKKDIETGTKTEEKARPQPMQTFYIPYNRPLSLGFSDSRFTSVNAMTAQAPTTRMGGVYGVVPGVTAMGIEDPDLYYQSVGQKMALAFNDYTFAPNVRASTAGSAIFQGSSAYNTGGSMINVNPTFTSHDDDDDIANDGTGYYHALGQKLAITFDQQE